MSKAHVVAATLAIAFAAASASAADKPARFWNKTDQSLWQFSVAPAGSAAFGDNILAKIKTLDPNERTPVGLGAGTYDAKVVDVTGRSCLVKNIKVTLGEFFWVDEAALKAGTCTTDAALAAAAPHVPAKPTRFWNLTGNDIYELYFAPAGTTKWTKNQVLNDDDGFVSQDERMKVTDVPTGAYDARFVDAAGRQCSVKNVPVRDGQIFIIDAAQPMDCTKK